MSVLLLLLPNSALAWNYDPSWSFCGSNCSDVSPSPYFFHVCIVSHASPEDIYFTERSYQSLLGSSLVDLYGWGFNGIDGCTTGSPHYFAYEPGNSNLPFTPQEAENFRKLSQAIRRFLIWTISQGLKLYPAGILLSWFSNLIRR